MSVSEPFIRRPIATSLLGVALMLILLGVINLRAPRPAPHAHPHPHEGGALVHRLEEARERRCAIVHHGAGRHFFFGALFFGAGFFFGAFNSKPNSCPRTKA